MIGDRISQYILKSGIKRIIKPTKPPIAKTMDPTNSKVIEYLFIAVCSPRIQNQLK